MGHGLRNNREATIESAATNGETDMNTRAGILESVSDWIKLLALIVLVVEAMLVVAMFQTPDNSPIKSWYPVIMIAPLTVIILGVFIDRYIYRPHPTDNTNIDTTETGVRIPNIPKIGDNDADDALKNVIKGILKALKINNSIFRGAILSKLHEFLADEINAWEKGEILVGERDSKEFLLELYKNAKNNIFSTSNKEFSKHWNEKSGERILQANKESNAQVTRVFIFDETGELTKEDVQQMRKQSEAGINVRVYFDKEDDFFQFPTNITRDFTIIDDGEVIGVTTTFRLEDYSAVWYFKNQNLSNQLKNVKKSLLSGSKPFHEIESSYQPQIDD